PRQARLCDRRLRDSSQIDSAYEPLGGASRSALVSPTGAFPPGPLASRGSRKTSEIRLLPLWRRRPRLHRRALRLGRRRAGAGDSRAAVENAAGARAPRRHAIRDHSAAEIRNEDDAGTALEDGTQCRWAATSNFCAVWPSKSNSI